MVLQRSENGEINDALENYMHYVLDSSVIIKWFSYHDEDNLDKAIRLMDLFGKNLVKISIPDLSIYEVSNALRQNKKFSSIEVKNSIKRLMWMELDIIEVEEDLICKAVDTAYEEDITVYDAIYISISDHMMIPLVTADKKQYNSAKKGNILHLKDIR